MLKQTTVVRISMRLDQIENLAKLKQDFDTTISALVRDAIDLFLEEMYGIVKPKQ